MMYDRRYCSERYGAEVGGLVEDPVSGVKK